MNDNWNVESIYELMRDIETTPDATMERNALLNLFDFIKQIHHQNEHYKQALEEISDVRNILDIYDAVERANNALEPSHD